MSLSLTSYKGLVGILINHQDKLHQDKFYLKGFTWKENVFYSAKLKAVARMRNSFLPIQIMEFQSKKIILSCPSLYRWGTDPERIQELLGVSEAFSEWQGCEFDYINDRSSFFHFICCNAVLGITSNFESCLISFRASGATYCSCLSLMYPSIHSTGLI